jgi:predicted mannosyl-3-phosphoglycerate phosphatase (HAD superfamily)
VASRPFLFHGSRACVCEGQSSHWSQPFSIAGSAADSAWSILLRSTTTVVYCSTDNLITMTNKALTGFADFLEGLAEANIPVVPVTSRSRLQFDAAIRKFGFGHPFLAEGGCGVFLPEDYFHLKPPRSMRLGRFTCVPVASPQPAAAEMLDLIAEETSIEVVPLRDLSPRELSQNTGLQQREAELLRQRDFDELFFFAGASDADIQRFQQEATKRKARVRPRGALWSLAVGAQLSSCMRDLSQLYQRSFRANPHNIGIATSDEATELFPTCDRCLLLAGRDSATTEPGGKCKSLPLFSPDTWPLALEMILNREL